MAKLGTEKKPAIVRVQNEHRAEEIASIFDKNGWTFILGVEPDKPEDISDLEKLLNPPKPVQSVKIGRNDPCPCGSGKNIKNVADEQIDSKAFKSSRRGAGLDRWSDRFILDLLKSCRWRLCR